MIRLIKLIIRKIKLRKIKKQFRIACKAQLFLEKNGYTIDSYNDYLKRYFNNGNK